MSVVGSGGVVDTPMQKLRRLRVVARWCERGRDVLAWRLRCERDGVALSWAAEVAKTGAVLAALVGLGFCSADDVELVQGSTAFRDALEDAMPEVAMLLPVLELRLSGLAEPGMPGVRGSKSAFIVAAVVRGLLPVVARLVVEDALIRSLDAVMARSAR